MPDETNPVAPVDAPVEAPVVEETAPEAPATPAENPVA